MAGCTCWLAPSRWSAVILAAGIGCLMVAVFAILGNKLAAMGHFFIFSKPTGSLFGVTTCAIAVWPESWGRRCISAGGRNVTVGRISAATIALLIPAFLLAFRKCLV